jgi:hypothetical protein
VPFLTPTPPPLQFIELGANWIQGLRGNPVFELAVTCGLNSTAQNWDSVTTFNELGQPLPDDQIPWDQFDTAVECAASTIKQQLDSNAYGDIDVRAAYRVW